MKLQIHDVRGIPILGSEWNVDEFIADEFKIPEVAPAIRAGFMDLLSRDVFSEGDSQPLYEHLLSRSSEFSLEFMSAIEFWLQDELRHYRALRKVYQMVSGMSSETIDRQNQSRVHELEPISFLIENEFTILVGLMFDEMGSVWSYHRDIAEFYRHYGNGFARVGHLVAQDEGRHFRNAATLLQHRHPDKLEQIEPLLQKIDRMEANLAYYPKTFFLDHAQERHRFPKDFNTQVIQRIISFF
jgi:rubrerythrin